MIDFVCSVVVKQPRINCGTLTWLWSNWKVRQGKNKACSPLFTLWISPSCCKRCKNKKKVRKKNLHSYTLFSIIVLWTRDGRGHKKKKHKCWGVVSAEEPSVSTPLTIWVRSLSWTDFMSVLIAHIWKRASSAAQHIEWVSEDKRGTSWQTGQRGKQNTATSSPVSQKMTQATDWQVQVMFFHRENVKKKKKNSDLSLFRAGVTRQLARGAALGLRREARRILEVSCEVEAGGPDLWCEQALLVLQVVAHVVLEGLLQEVASAGQEKKEGRREGELTVPEVRSRNTKDYIFRISDGQWHTTHFPITV